VSDRHDGQQVVKAFEILWIGSERRKIFGDRGGGDHEVDHPAAWFASAGDHRRGHSSVDPGCFGVEGDRVEFAFGALQYVVPAGPFYVLVIGILLVVPAYFVWPAESSASVMALWPFRPGVPRG
jgi:hypothetical protein